MPAKAKAKEARKVETISANFSGHGRQTVTYQEVLELKLIRGGNTYPHKLRIIIKSDSYVFQSSAKIERWDGNQWHTVHFIGGGPMKTDLSYNNDPRTAHVQADRTELLRVAEAILG